jgi:hypothetical protein
MKPTPGIAQLAEQMMERHADKYRDPLILFLGKECADAAGVPGVASIARQVFSDPFLPEATYVTGQDLDDSEALVQAFYRLLSDMPSGQRYRMLQSFYKGVPVPSFYQDLAALVKAGHFPHILTTSIDTLLEQALNGAGLWPGKDYQVISLGPRQDRPPDVAPSGPADVQIHIVKLHGDLAQSEFVIAPDEITRALEPQRRFVKGELSGDMVIVGYEFESEPLNQWLAWTPGTLWWVSEQAADAERMAPIEEKRHVVHIQGENARPESIFGQLVYLLLRRPEWTPTARSVIESATEEASAWSVPKSLVTDIPSADEYSDSEYLRGQIQRSQQVLYELEQNVIPGERNVQLETQITYQRRKIVELEDQWRNLDGNRERVLSLMEQIKEAVAQARPDDTRTVSFVQDQFRVVDQEYSHSVPNQDIISASVGAAVVLAERLGPDVVKPDVVQELAAFAPRVVVGRAS